MTTETFSKFKIESWDEQPYLDEGDGRKLTRAQVKQTFQGGDVDGHGQVEWLMAYRPDGTADYIGLQHIVGHVGGRAGSLVLLTSGTFDGQEAQGPLTVVRGSGTGELEGIVGEGELRAPFGSEPTVTLTYRFD